MFSLQLFQDLTAFGIFMMSDCGLTHSASVLRLLPPAMLACNACACAAGVVAAAAAAVAGAADPGVAPAGAAAGVAVAVAGAVEDLWGTVWKNLKKVKDDT